jgi:acetyl-CoA carboxylase alpha subunit
MTEEAEQQKASIQICLTSRWLTNLLVSLRIPTDVCVIGGGGGGGRIPTDFASLVAMLCPELRPDFVLALL